MFCRFCSADIPDESNFCLKCGRKQETATTKKVKHRGNGDGSVYKQGNTWTAAVTLGYDANGKRTVRRKYGFPTRKEALEYIPQLRNAPAPRKALLVKDLWSTFETTQLPKLAKNTQGHYRTAAKRLDPLFNYPIKDLVIDDWQDTISLAVSTHYPAKDMRDLVSWLYKLAMVQQEVPMNLSQFILLPDLNEKEPVPFSKDEILKFWKYWGKGYIMCGYILLMIYTGMMPGELLKLTKNMIDLESQTINGVGLKTHKRKTTSIVLADVLLPVVEQLMHHSKGLLLWEYSRDRFYSEYWECIDKCEVSKLKPYSCRHTTATALALAKTSPETIKEVMRHSSLTTTQRYIHLTSDVSLSAVNNLELNKVANK